jgi:WD40 repeat protein
VRVWDLAQGTPVGEPFTGHSGAVNAVAVAKLKRRPVVVFGGSDQKVWVRDLALGTPVRELPVAHWHGVNAVTVAELESRPVVVSAGQDGAVRVWDLAQGTLVGEPLTRHGRVNVVAVGEFGGRPVVVSAGADGTVRVWEETGRLRQMIELGSAIYALSLVQEGGCVLGGVMGVMALSWKPSRP